MKVVVWIFFVLFSTQVQANELWLAWGQSNFTVFPSVSWVGNANALLWNNEINIDQSVGTAFAPVPSNTISPPWAFAAERARLTGQKIYVLQVAAHDNPISQWLPGAVTGNGGSCSCLQDMYQNMEINAPAAMTAAGVGQFTGILFWDGETDVINGSTTWRVQFNQLAARLKSDHPTWYPSVSNSFANWIIFGVGGARNGSPLGANGDAFNANYVVPTVNDDLFFRFYVNTSAWPQYGVQQFWSNVTPGHMTGPGYYEVGVVAARMLTNSVPVGAMTSSGN